MALTRHKTCWERSLKHATGLWHCSFLEFRISREVKHYVYGKQKSIGSCVSQKRENLRFSTCLTLLRSYSICLVNRQERSSISSSFSVFWQKGNFNLPFAVNVMLNLSIVSPSNIMSQSDHQPKWSKRRWLLFNQVCRTRDWLLGLNAISGQRSLSAFSTNRGLNNVCAKFWRDKQKVLWYFWKWTIHFSNYRELHLHQINRWCKWDGMKLLPLRGTDLPEGKEKAIKNA